MEAIWNNVKSVIRENIPAKSDQPEEKSIGKGLPIVKFIQYVVDIYI